MTGKLLLKKLIPFINLKDVIFINICLFTTSFFPNIGGTEVFTHNLANSLAKLGNRVSILSPKISCRYDAKVLKYSINEYDDNKYIIKPFKGLQLMVYLLKTKAKEKFDVLQACLTFPPGFCGAIFKKLINVPLIVRAGGADIQKIPEINYGLRLNPIIEKMIKFGLDNANAIVSNSEYIEQDVLQLGDYAKKINIIPNGINIERFNRKKEIKLLESYNIPVNNKIILAVGRYHIKKGFENLLYAMKDIKKEVSDVSCVIVGRENDKLLNLIKKLELQDVIFIINQVDKNKKEILNFNKIPSDEIISFYCSSDIYVSTSIVEGFPTTNIEALAAGLPLILTDKNPEKGWTKEYLENNKNGFQISPHNIGELKNKLLTLLADDKLRNSMSKESKKLSKKFDWNVIGKRYMKLYENVLSHLNN